jgi:hypothetical protein
MKRTKQHAHGHKEETTHNVLLSSFRLCLGSFFLSFLCEKCFLFVFPFLSASHFLSKPLRFPFLSVLCVRSVTLYFPSHLLSRL